MTTVHTTLDAVESYSQSDYPQFARLYDEDDNLLVEVSATGNAVWDDYGVPGSPRWITIDDIMIDEIVVNGIVYSFKKLCEVFGAELADDLHSVCAEAAEKGEWE